MIDVFSHRSWICTKISSFILKVSIQTKDYSFVCILLKCIKNKQCLLLLSMEKNVSL